MNKKTTLVFFTSLISGTGASCLEITPCASIQFAVNASAAGDTIYVAAGEYFENITIPREKTGLHISGMGDKTKVISAGGNAVPKQAPSGVPIDVIFDIFASDMTLEKIALEHPAGFPTKRDIGIFVRPPANNVTIQKTVIQRSRTGGTFEPTNPGSRGILVVRAKGTTIAKNKLSGDYEDHLHIASSDTTMDKNTTSNAKRFGVVIIQETPTSDSTNNVITRNTILGSGADGIQIQGDENMIVKNTVSHSGSAGIRLCGSGDCVPPGVSAVASNNNVIKNKLNNNVLGDIIDNGSGNIVIDRVRLD